MAGTGMESLTPVGLTCFVHPGPSKLLRRSSSAAPDPHCTLVKPFSERDFALGGSLALLAGVSSVRRRCPHQRIPTLRMFREACVQQELVSSVLVGHSQASACIGS